MDKSATKVLKWRVGPPRVKEKSLHSFSWCPKQTDGLPGEKDSAVNAQNANPSDHCVHVQRQVFIFRETHFKGTIYYSISNKVIRLINYNFLFFLQLLVLELKLDAMFADHIFLDDCFYQLKPAIYLDYRKPTEETYRWFGSSMPLTGIPHSKITEA